MFTPYGWRRTGAWIVAVLLGLGAFGASAAEYGLVFEQTAEESTILRPASEALGASKGKPVDPANASVPGAPTVKRTRGRVEIVLGDTYLVHRDDTKTTVYDFAAKRISSRVGDSGPWHAASLYSDLWFRVAEYQNRQAIGKAFTAGGIGATTLGAGFSDDFELQHLFGLVMPTDRDAPVKELTMSAGADGGFVVKWKDREVTRCEFSASVVPVEFRPMAERAFTYLVRLHPRIRHELCAVTRVPQRLRTEWRSPGTEGWTEWTLQSVVVREGREEAPSSSWTYEPQNEGPLTEALRASHDAARWEKRTTSEEVMMLTERAMAAKRPLEALLTLLECNLQSGDDVSALIRRHQERFEKDKACRILFSALKPKDKAGAEKALAALRGIDRRSLQHGHVLDIFIANTLTALGKNDEAEKSFLTALQANPFIAGVWKDLGDLHRRNYHTQEAWLCYDNARRLYPAQRMLEEVTKLESRLEKDFPEFFAPRGK